MTDNAGKISPGREKKHNARVRLFQILCALDGQSAPPGASEIEARFEDLFALPDGGGPDVPDADGDDDAVARVPRGEFRATCAAASRLLAARAEIDALIGKNLSGWSIGRMTLVDRTLIRLAVFEAFVERGVSVAVAVSEAVLIAKEFSGDDSGRFVNGVLARVAKAVEP